jgi:DNA primase
VGLFPQAFVDDLKQQADIVTVVQDYVTLRRSGATYKGLCPFHGEKTPSFHVNKDKGFFHCFGCGVGGDAIKFLELHDKVSFPEAVKLLAQRFGLELPELEQSDDQRAHAAERESLLKVHEAADAWFRAQLAGPGGARVRQQVAERGVSDATAGAMGLGFAPPDRDGLVRELTGHGYTTPLLVRAGLAFQRDDGSLVDRFRNRLIIPIRRDTGSVIAFGGRAVAPDQQPKYLNSPETPIYTKSRTLYGLDLAKQAIRKGNFAILVEGYFDLGALHQAGFANVVASCGTALTAQQAQLLRRFTGRVVISFDPDAAGQGAAAKSCELLVAEGFDVNVVMLPAGEDPDTFVRRHGQEGYQGQLRASRPYLDYLLDRAAGGHNLNTDEGRVRFLGELLPVAARIPDAAARDRFADRLAFKAKVTDEVVRAEIRKAAVQRRTDPPPASRLTGPGRVTRAEKGLIWWLVHRHADALPALEALEPGDTDGLGAGSVLDLALKLNEDRGFTPSLFLERLSTGEARLVTEVASEPEPPVHEVEGCVRVIRTLRYARERADVQREIDRLQQQGASEHGREIDELWVKKQALLRRIEGLTE